MQLGLEDQWWLPDLISTKYATPKEIMKKLDLVFITTIQCLELCHHSYCGPGDGK
jgi:hypothetical protein